MGFVVFLCLVICSFAALRNYFIKARQKRFDEAYDFQPPQAQGSARFADEADIEKAGMFKDGAIHIGFFKGRKLYANSSGHLLLVAGARTGKLLTILCAAILNLPKWVSLCLFDPKAEITCIVGHFLQACGRDVFVLNPFCILTNHMKGLKQATFNPLSSLAPSSPNFHSDCDKIAEAINYEEGSKEDSHWILSARELVSGVIAALVKYGQPHEKNLVAMRNVITGASGVSVYEFCRECMKLPDMFMRQKLARFAAPGAEDNKEISSIVSTAITQSAFIGNEAMAANLKGGPDEINPRDLKRKPGTVFAICLPLDKMDVGSKWYRIVTSTVISLTLNEALNGGAEVVGIWDEAYQAGYLRVMANAWGMAAGAADLRMWGVWQDISQISSQFRGVHGTIIQNSSAALFFGIRDQETADFVSKLCGTGEVLSRSRSVGIDRRSGEPVVNDNMTQTARPLLHADEVRFGLGAEDGLLFADGLPGVCWMNRRRYIDQPDLKGKYRGNPYFKPNSRQASRRFWSWLFE